MRVVEAPPDDSSLYSRVAALNVCQCIPNLVEIWSVLGNLEPFGACVPSVCPYGTDMSVKVLC